MQILMSSSGFVVHEVYLIARNLINYRYYYHQKQHYRKNLMRENWKKSSNCDIRQNCGELQENNNYLNCLIRKNAVLLLQNVSKYKILIAFNNVL